MPILEVYSGKTSIEATSKNESTTIYSNSKTAYGQTLGELLDNLVAASIALANETYKWIAQNKPTDYTLQDDYWSSFTSHPDILESHMKSTPSEKYDEKYDMGSGGSIQTIKEIVTSSILHRDLSISSALGSLSREINEPSELPKNAAVPHSDVYEAATFQEMIRCGYTGSELDSILDISKREGRLESYLLSLANMRSVHARRQKESAREKQKAEKRRKKS